MSHPAKLKFDSVEQARVAGLGSRPDAAIAAEHGVTRQAVAAARKRLGIPSITNGEAERIKAVIKAGRRKLSVSEAAEKLSVSTHTIRMHARKLGVTLARKHTPRPSRYTDEQLIEALKKAKSLRGAASLLGTHESNLYYMLRIRGLRDRVSIPDGRSR